MRDSRNDAAHQLVGEILPALRDGIGQAKLDGGSDALPKLTSDRAEDRCANQEKRELRTAQPDVESTSRRKKVGNLPAPKS